MPSEEKLARRREFSKYKAKLLNQSDIKSLICARCGYANSSHHLHHLSEVVYGGQDTPDNLIPLCAECHHEWDICCAAGMSFGEFLVSISSSTLQLAIKRGLITPELPFSETLKILYMSQFSTNSLKNDSFEYWEELDKQNKVFSTYPYSNPVEMLSLYGSMYKTA